LKKLRKKYKGFTLIEVLVVLFIIAAMAIILIPNMMKQAEKAQDTKDIIKTTITSANNELNTLESEMKKNNNGN